MCGTRFRPSGTSAPRWVQVAGYDIAADFPIDIADQETPFSLSLLGVTATWAIVSASFDGFDPELAMITALDADGLVVSIDRYSMPNPESSAAATIAAQERSYLQALLNTRSAVADSGGFARQGRSVRHLYLYRDHGHRHARSASR